MGNILFFDTETNGLPKDWRAPVTDVDNWPRVIQLAYEICDQEENVLGEEKNLVKPDGWEIPKLPFWEKHGYYTEVNEQLGAPMKPLLENFANAINYFEVELLVAHNMKFDQNVLGAEMIRYGISLGRQVKKFCTMKESIYFCALPGLKFPKLEELYFKLFGESFSGAHDAGNDVAACRKAFFELRKILQLPG